MPSCTHPSRKCIDSRDKGEYRYRRYRCNDCGLRFSTIEVPVPRSRRSEALIDTFVRQIMEALK